MSGGMAVIVVLVVAALVIGPMVLRHFMHKGVDKITDSIANKKRQSKNVEKTRLSDTHTTSSEQNK